MREKTNISETRAKVGAEAGGVSAEVARASANTDGAGDAASGTGTAAGTKASKPSTIAWALKAAWEINGALLAAVLVAVAVLSVLPAVSLAYNKESIALLSDFIATGQGTFEDMLRPLLAYGCLLALITLSARLNTEFIASLTDNVYAYGMQERLMAAVHRADILSLMQRNVNEDFNYIVRQSHALNRLVSGLCSIAGKAFTIGSLCVAAWGLARPVMVITLAYVAVVLVVSARFGKGTRFSFSKFRKAEVKAQYLQNMPMEGNIAKEIRVYGCAEGVIGSWRAAYGERLGMDLARFKATEVQSFLLGAVFYVFLAVSLAYLLVLVAEGAVTPAVLLTVFTLCTNLFSAVSVLARDLVLFDDHLFALEQQKTLLFDGLEDAEDAEAARAGEPGGACSGTPVPRVPSHAPSAPAHPRKPADPTPVFSARGLAFSYDGEHQALKGVDLDIMPGEVVALIGENGSGKSTLVKLLMGVFKPAGGTLDFFGAPIEQCSPDEMGRRIGVFFQDFYLFHHTLAENVAYGDADNIGNLDMVTSALERGGAQRVVAKLPKGLDTMLGKRIDKEGVELSGGERQLIATARAYMSDKDVLIFDEPASMLDPLAEIEQFRAIRGRVGDKTGILISHRVGFARLADRIIMMDGGRIAETGTHEELMALDGLYADFFREQAQWYQGAEDDRNAEGGAR